MALMFKLKNLVVSSILKVTPKKQKKSKINMVVTKAKMKAKLKKPNRRKSIMIRKKRQQKTKRRKAKKVKKGKGGKGGKIDKKKFLGKSIGPSKG